VIVELLIRAVLTFFGALLELLPVWVMPDFDTAAAWRIGAWIKQGGFLFPYATFFTVLGLVFTITALIGAARFVMWVWDKLPFKSS
jgi:hypothetical protein